MWLSIFNNPLLHALAETLAIVVGSVLLGIWLGWLAWGEYKKKSIKYSKSLDLERDQSLQLKEHLNDLEGIRDHLQQELASEKAKYSQQSRSIYDQSQRIYDQEREIRQLQETIEHLNGSIDAFEKRLKVISDGLSFPPPEDFSTKRNQVSGPARANYEHVSQVLGRQVTENDLTLMVGIGPKTATLLQAHGIATWDQLGKTPPARLREILDEAGGIYRSIDPTHWPKQAVMASLSEWRKLRVYQEALKKVEG